MANSTTEKTKAAPAQPVSMMAVLAPAVGWLIPGAGHMMQKRWIRGGLLFVSIVTLFLLGLAMQGRIYKANGGDILDMLGFIGDFGAGALYILTAGERLGTGCDRLRHCRLRDEVHDRRGITELYCGGGRVSHRDWEKAMKQFSVLGSQFSVKTFPRGDGSVTITLNHFSAAAVFALFASIVFGITHRETTRDMVRYGLYCFAMFLGGVLLAGWAMWLLRR